MSYERKTKDVFCILILGDSTVGKTCFLIRFNEDFFQEVYLATMGYDFKLKHMALTNGKEITAKMWDTAGQERFKCLAKNYYKGAHGILLIYDVTNAESFENIETWMDQIREKAPSNIQIILVGNKCDLKDKRKIMFEQGQEMAKKYQIPFFETSVKNNENIKETFQFLVDKIGENFVETPRKNEQLIPSPAPKKTRC